MPIIELQRRLVQVGRIRLGTKQGNRPVRLDTWRLTSRDQRRLEAAASLYGGEVKEWAERAGEYELVTEAVDLPIMVLPGQTITQWYESWTAGGCKRRCDGETETISDGPCVCDPEKRECKPHTRLSVILPDVPGFGLWRLDTSGWNAARELVGAVEFLEQHTAQGQIVPARLRIDQRHEIRDGQTKKYPVPVLDIDMAPLALTAPASAAIAGSHAQVSVGYKPIAQLPAGNGVSLEQGLAAAETQTVTRTARSAAPIPTVDDYIPFGDEPVPVPEEPGAVGDAAVSGSAAKHSEPEPAPGNSLAASTKDKPITKAMSTKLGILVRELRDEAGIVTTEQLIAGVARNRNVPLGTMLALPCNEDGVTLGDAIGHGTGEVHFGPLMATLTRAEGHQLIDQLEKLKARHAA